MYLLWKSLGYDFRKLAVLAMAVLLLGLGWSSLVHVYGDLTFYPEFLQKRMRGGTVFFPLIVAFSLLGYPFLLQEQRRQLRRFSKRLHLPTKVSRRYAAEIGRISKREQLIIAAAGTTTAIIYMLGTGLLFVDGLTVEQNVRRIMHVLLPMIMWTQFFEITLTVVRSNRLLLRYERRYAPSFTYRPIDLHPLARFILNQLTFIAFAFSLLPIMWFGSAIPWYDVLLASVYFAALYGVIVGTAWQLRRRMKARKNLALAGNGSQRRNIYMSFDPTLDSDVMRVLAEYMAGVQRETILSRRAAVQFFFFLTPIPLWFFIYGIFVGF